MQPMQVHSDLKGTHSTARTHHCHLWVSSRQGVLQPLKDAFASGQKTLSHSDNAAAGSHWSSEVSWAATARAASVLSITSVRSSMCCL